MIRAEFGIIDDFNEKNDYTGYYPDKYRCVAVDDDIYLNDWWDSLTHLDTFNVCNSGVLQSQKALSRWGITIIPPKSLPAFLDIVVTDDRYNNDKHLIALAELIRQAIHHKKYMIHYGV